MKWFYLAGVIPIAFAVSVQAAAQSPASTNNAHAEAIELLRRVIAEQQQNPGKIIRSPTNPLPRAAAPLTNSSGTAAIPTNRPAATAVSIRATRAELEKQFLDGKITAKQYQRAVLELEKNPPVVAAPPAESKPIAGSPVPLPPKAASAEKAVTPASPVPKAASTASAPAAKAAPKAAAPEAKAEVLDDDAIEQKTLTEVEAKIDEILARRAALQEAARTNNAASTNGVLAGTMTKRQKLDALLRELIQGKISEKDYIARRELIIGEPD